MQVGVIGSGLALACFTEAIFRTLSIFVGLLAANALKSSGLSIFLRSLLVHRRDSTNQGDGCTESRFSAYSGALRLIMSSFSPSWKARDDVELNAV